MDTGHGNVSAVMGAHHDVGQVVSVAVHGFHWLKRGWGVAWVDVAGEHLLLRDVYDSLSISSAEETRRAPMSDTIIWSKPDNCDIAQGKIIRRIKA
jgi:hypothetical protein